MGRHNSFRGLRKDGEASIDGVTKLSKFKQQHMLLEACAFDGLPVEDYERTLEGVCDALVMRWLSGHVAAGDGPVEAVPSQVRNNAAATRWAAVAAGQHLRRRAAAERSIDQYLTFKMWATGHFRVEPDRPDEHAGIREAARGAMAELDRSPLLRLGAKVGCYLSIRFQVVATPPGVPQSNADQGHAVGLVRSAPDRFRFFDPNVGEYEVNRAALGAFFDRYTLILSAGWKVTKVCVFNVTGPDALDQAGGFFRGLFSSS